MAEGDASSRRGGESQSLNVHHFCLVTEMDDVEALKRHFEREGYPVVEGPGERWGARGTGLSVYVNDPDSNVVEIRTYRGAATAAGVTGDLAQREAAQRPKGGLG